MKKIAAAAFQAKCLRVVNQVNADCEPVTITNRGRPVAVLSPAPDEAPSVIGAMKGSVLVYDAPFQPAADPADWEAGASLPLP